jgi:hypothetical protein
MLRDKNTLGVVYLQDVIIPDREIFPMIVDTSSQTHCSTSMVIDPMEVVDIV